ncbi:MAG: IS630 family transposase, partial [Bdellovibrionales bacterium]
AQALRIHEETVRQHLSEWETDEKLKPENGGSWSKLKDNESQMLETHLEENIYTRVIEICAYVEKTFHVSYTVSGMTKWLRQHNFSYKKPKEIPAKADAEKQEIFIEEYLKLVEETPLNEPILFADSTHPTMATKIVCGWIRKGTDKPIAQIASRTRVNVMGAIELSTMNIVSWQPEFVNGETTTEFFKKVKIAYPHAPKIHIILDQSGYHRSQQVKEFAKVESIELHYLPPYSPNLNPIERLWKVMNEQVRNNRVFKSAKEFRDAIVKFFDVKLPDIAHTLRSRINDNFQIVNPVPSG